LRILLTGRNGQVGWELERLLPSLGEVIATDRATLDLADPDAIRRVVREAKPDVIVNAAAYTAVDKAESEPELAVAINARAPEIFAEEAKRTGALLIQYSTDYVFDGLKQEPYTEHDSPNPLSVYGRTKLEGDLCVLTAGCSCAVLRTSWVYGPRGKNFLLTILRKGAAGESLRIVDDQRGAPTASDAIARATCDVIGKVLADPTLGGLCNLSAAGATTWHGFAVHMLAAAGMRADVKRIPSREFKAAAQRPHNSLLDHARLVGNFGIRMESWQQGCERVVASLPARA
jgi:dTDP-4-dehydrorhamnose reductase